MLHATKVHGQKGRRIENRTAEQEDPTFIPSYYESKEENRTLGTTPDPDRDRPINHREHKRPEETKVDPTINAILAI